MKLIFNSIIPQSLKVGGITLYPFVLFAKSKEYCPATLIKHEMIHIEQIERIGVVRFYCSYLWQYVKGRFSGMGHHSAYRSISFEIEAYKRQGEP